MVAPESHWLEQSNLIMQHAKFEPDEVHAAVVWAARWQACPKCKVEAYEQCVNLLDQRIATKRPGYQIRKIKWPHEERVDREKLVMALRRKGYGSG